MRTPIRVRGAVRGPTLPRTLVQATDESCFPSQLPRTFPPYRSALQRTGRHFGLMTSQVKTKTNVTRVLGKHDSNKTG